MCRDCYKKQRTEDHRNSLLNVKAQITGEYPPKSIETPAGPPLPSPAADPVAFIKAVIAAPSVNRALNTFDDAVVDHCVRALLACQMDAVKAVKLIAAHETEAVQKEMIEILRTDIRIKIKLTHDLTALGLDEDSKKKFLATMTYWLYNESDPRLKATAARVFAKAFIAERIEEKRIEDLPIRDFGEGIKAMLAEAPKHDEVN